MRQALLFLLGVLLSYPAASADWYINPDAGASGYPGTQIAPKSNCSQVSASAGDAIYFARGTTHNGQCTLVNGTNPSTRTVYGAYGEGPRPVLRHSGNVLIRNAAAYLSISDLVLNPTTTGTSDAGLRTDRGQYITVNNVDFVGGRDGWRAEIGANPGAELAFLTLTNSTFTGQAENGVRWVLGENPVTNASTAYVGHDIYWQNVSFKNIAKEPFRLTQQSAAVTTREHRWYSVVMDDVRVKDSMLATPSIAAVDDDQCMHFRNLRETVLGNSRLTRLRIENCGRVAGDSSLLTGLWVEGLTNTIVEDFHFDGVFTPGLDGGALFLDASAADGSGFNSTGNYFRRGFIANTRGNSRCVPITSTQCNNSDAISVTRASSGNTFESIVMTKNVIGLHVTGNAGANTYSHLVSVGNDYGAYIQTNSADTPAGLAQTIRNSIFWGNAVSDYQHTTSFPKAAETFNDIGVIVNDTRDATTLSVDPQFVGGPIPSTAMGFQLKPTSPLIGAGTYVGKVYDYRGRRFGVPANIGAFGQHMAASRRVAPLQ